MMTFFVKAATWISQTFGLLPLTAQTGGVLYTPKSVSEEGSLGLTAVWACVRLLAETVGSLPMFVYERSRNGNKAKATTHYLHPVLHDSPNQYSSSVEVKEALIAGLALWGNAYAAIERNSAGQVIALYPIHPARVTVNKASDGTLTYKVALKSGSETYTADQILHIRGFGFDGVVGLPPIATCRQALGLAVAAEEYGGRWFATGKHQAGILSTALNLTPEQSTALATKFNQLYSGLDKSQGVIVLGGDMKYHPLSIPPADSQFIESRKFQTAEIARIFRVPLHMVGDLDRSTNNNIEQQSTEFVMYTLKPYLTRFEQAVNRALFKPDERGRYFVEFSLDALLRADAAGRAALYSSLLQNGVYTRNEVRSLENLPAIDGGDMATVQLNMQRLTDVGKQVRKQ